jgi:hypothetical protein
MRESLQDQRDRLATELNDALLRQGTPALLLTFDGPPVSGDTLSAGFIGRVLEGAQLVVEAIGHALAGEPTRAGFVPGTIRSTTELRLAGFAHGSFGVQLIGRLGPDQQEMFEPGVQGGLLEQSLERLVAIVDIASQESDDEALLDSVADLGQRAVSRLRTWTKAFVDSGAELHVRWESPHLDAHGAELSPARAVDLLDFLEAVDSDVDEVNATGRLVGARMHRDTFDLEIADGVVLSGRVAPSAREKIGELFGKMCRARLERTVALGRAGRRSAEKYLLLDLEVF